MKLPIGIQDFEKIRTGGYLYVDKTEQVYRLVSEGSYYFLSRPRRFGKSLLLSTIKALFQGKRELFKGLAIDKKEDWDWVEHPILHLDLNTEKFSTKEALENKINTFLSIEEEKYGKVEWEKSFGTRFEGIIKRAYEKTGQRVVILVDEYDKPMLQAIGNKELQDEYRGTLKGFFFIVSSMLSGACATPEFLMYLNYFIGKEYGKDYWKEPDKVVDLSLRQRTIDKIITDCFEQIVYSINQPTGARNFQAVFWNIAYYDKFYFDSLFGNFFFPDGSQPDWNGLSWLQKRFMKWFNKERTKTVLTFPVETMALLADNGECRDKEWGDFAAEMYSEGHSFFTYMSDNADSLSSCCRLRNEIQDNGFSYTLGAGGVSTGSKSVLTVNLNRCVQFAVNNGRDYKEYLEEVIDLCHKVQLAYNENLKELQEHGMLPLFDAGYINMSRQYLTIGVNGLVEAAEFMGLKITANDKYKEFVQGILSIVEKLNKKYRTKDVLFNCEMIPAENVGVKHAKWDREDGYYVPRDCYNSYFYVVEDQSLNIIDKFKMHGAPYIEHLTGGSALHMNLEEHLSKKQYQQLLRVAAKEGCNYFTFNIPNTICNNCGHIDKRYLTQCPTCHSSDVDYMTRIIGYLKRVSNFSAARQKEAARRFYAGSDQMGHPTNDAQEATRKVG